MTNHSASSSIDEAALAARARRIFIFLRRKWWIPAFLVILAAGGQAAHTLMSPETYTAAARMWVGGKVRLPESSYFSEEWQNFFGTQTELMESEKIRRRVLSTLQNRTPGTNAEPIRVKVSQPRKTTIFNLTATAPNPGYLEEYLNTLMDEYLNYKREVRASSSDDTVASLSEQLEKIERELKEEQSRLTDFQRSNNITVLQESSVSAGNQLAKLNLQLAELKLEAEILALMSLEEHLEKSQSALETRAAPDSSATKDYFSVRQQRDIKIVERKDLSKYLRPEHPTIIKLDEQIAQFDSLLEIYLQQSGERLKSTQETLRLKIAAVEDAIKKWTPQVVDANERLAQHERLKTNLDRNETKQTRLLQAIHNVDVNKSVDQESVSIMDRATAFPTPKRLGFKIGLAAAVAFIAGLGIVLFLERQDQRVLAAADVRSGLNARLLACIPETASTRSQTRMDLLAPGDQRHIFVEAFRTLRGSLRSLRANDAAPQVLLVTSSTPDEGKSTVAVNLAFSLAFAGSRVLLVDADLRCGKLHEMLGLNSTPGLGDLGAGKQLDDLRQTAQSPNLTFIAAGKIFAGASEILSQAAFKQLLQTARANFDYVLIDTSPVLASADPCAIANLADAVLFVVRARFAEIPMARQATEQLREHGAPLIATILNRVDPRSPDFPYFRYPHYAAGLTTDLKTPVKKEAVS